MSLPPNPHPVEVFRCTLIAFAGQRCMYGGRVFTIIREGLTIHGLRQG